MTLLSSCSSETSFSQSVTQEELAAIKAGFVQISEEDLGCNNMYHSMTSRSAGNECIVLSLKFHRKLLNCEGGHGLCYINPNPLPFPPSFPDVNDRTDLSTDLNTGSAMLLSEANGTTFIELKFASDPTSYEGMVALLYVDEDITGEYTTNEGITYITTIRQGAYRYNPNLGTYGGYRIPVILTVQMSN